MHIDYDVLSFSLHFHQDLPACIDDLLLPLSHDIAADMYIIGTQESTPSR